MAKVKLNPVLEQIRGRVGDLVFRRRTGGVVVSRNPDRSGLVLSALQEAVRERFRLAALYGNAVYADPAQKEVYLAAAKKRGVTAFALAVGDFLHAPSVDEIDLTGFTGQPGETIVVRASDDFGVARVSVVIRAGDGTIVEQGPAAFERGAWRYTTTVPAPVGQPVVVEVTASDRAGNKTVESLTHG